MVIQDDAIDRLVFRLRSVELESETSSSRRGQQLSDDYTLLLMTELDGKGSVAIGTAEYSLHRDAVYLCPPGQTYGITAPTVHQWKLYAIRFELFLATREHGISRMVKLESGEGLPITTYTRLDSTCGITGLCQSIVELWKSEQPLLRFRSQLLFDELLYSLIKHSTYQKVEDSVAALELAKAYIDREYSSNISIEQLARIVKVSPSYFIELFKKTYGVSAIDYVTQVRIRRAKQLLSRTDSKLKDIARQVGYRDEYYFSRRFKHATGIPPTEYARSRKRRIAVYQPSVIGSLLPLNMLPYAAPLHPKWTASYYQLYRDDIAVHLDAYRENEYWEANIAKLLQAEPEIIFCLDHVSPKERLFLESSPNPIVLIPAELSWRGRLHLIAERLGETAEAEDWLRSYEGLVLEARAKLHQTVKEDRFLILKVSGQKISMTCNRSMLEVFYQELGMNSVSLGYEGMYDQPFMLHELAELQADRLLVLIRQDDETLNYWTTVKRSSEWRQLMAVRNEHVYTITSDPWREYSAHAHERLIKQSLRLIAGYCPNENPRMIHGRLPSRLI